VYVDWSNVRLSLACARRQAGPEWVLGALVEAVRRLASSGGAGLTIVLHLATATELRADRVLLAELAARADVALRQRAEHAEVTDVALALGVCGAWHDGGDGDIAVVSDQRRLAYVVAQFARPAGPRRTVRLLHLHDRPPVGGAGLTQAGLSRHLRLAVDQPAERRAWTDWDLAAWALRKLAAYTQMDVAERALRPPPGRTQRDMLRRADVEATGWERLDRVDSLVADLWRLRWGQPIVPEEARAEAERRLGAGHGRAALDALLVAQLVRWHDPDHLEVPSSWREGLLLPARRAVLGLARQPDRAHPMERLERRHRQRCITPQSQPLLPVLEQAARADSWRWVKHALRDRLRVVVERTERRAGFPSSRAVWRLAPRELARDTVATADRILGPLGTPLTVDELEDALGPSGIWRLGRWLRCLRDVGLVEHRDGRWLRRPGSTLYAPE
jgi:hypothetical protein